MATLTTRLRALNTMLSVIGEAPMNSVNINLSVDGRIANDILDEVTRDVCAEQWNFNRETKTIQPDGSGFIHLPGDTYLATVDPATGSGIDPVQRGTKLYDKKNNTFVFSSGVEVKLVLGLDFEEIPEVYRQYIMIRAARVFQDRRLRDSDSHTYTLQDEMVARSKAIRADSVDGQYSIFDSPDVGQIIARGTRPYRPNG